LKIKIITMLLLLIPAASWAMDRHPAEYFSFTVEVTVQGSADTVFEAITGDISGWWDHSFSETPLKLYVDPYPGGAFMEIFDKDGFGVRHAVVTAAEYGRMLRYEGPLGLAGSALFMVTTWTLNEADEGKTLVSVEVHASGEVKEGIPEILQKTWGYFLNDRLKPFLEK
jgi:hypothetical protein